MRSKGPHASATCTAKNCACCVNMEHGRCWSGCTRICFRFGTSYCPKRSRPGGRPCVEELGRAHTLCRNPDLSIDNNHTERALRCFAVGRANWTFFGSDRGGGTAAVLRSFVTSCELIKVDPFAWFRDVLSRIAEFPITKLDELLPHRCALAYSSLSSSDGVTRIKI
jgi:hypothetical protein